MDAKRVVFEIRDASDQVVLRLDAADVPRKLPPAFQLVRGGGKKEKPKLLLFRTADRNAKLSEWLEDWKTFSSEERRWVGSGASILRIVDSGSSQVDKFFVMFGHLPPSRNRRAEYFHFDLDAEAKAAFAQLPLSTQIALLCVSARMQPKFQKDGVCAYAEHIALRHERRNLEKEAAAEKSRLANAAAYRMMAADRSSIADEDVGFVGVGSARYTHEISRVERSPLDMLMFDVTAMFDGGALETAEEKLCAPVCIPMVVRQSQSEAKREARTTSHFLLQIHQAQQCGQLNGDVMHRCWFFYVLTWIRRQRAHFVRYHTEAILRNELDPTGDDWVKTQNGVSFRPSLDVIPLDEETKFHEMTIILDAVSERRRNRRLYY